MSRIGMLGGSFDPIHIGHIWIATLAREQLHLDRVWIVPAAAPPHKMAGTVAPYALRFEMVRRSTENRPGLAASDLEADPSRPSYTVESLRNLRGRLDPRDEIFLLLGADSLQELSTWREPDEILRLARLAIYARPGSDGPVPSGARLTWIEGPTSSLSSTWIRDRLRAGRAVDGFVPDEILPILASAEPYRKE